ncbi:MAG: rhodanese-like domain-containing protein [Bacillota bacterium]
MTATSDDLDVRQLSKLLAQNSKLFLLDVREPEEFAKDSIPGSVNVPLRGLPKYLAQLSPDDTIVCICESGRRSRIAAGALARLGYKQVRNFTAGMKGWREQSGGGGAP